ncbi:MAG: zinc-binding dehydrogenase, partial [Myxococcales bacterium]|nr:zinc-binding dehydrogenase [Myxococcales bacterium]
MKAVIFEKPGDESVLTIGEADRPAMEPGCVRLRVHSSAVNRADLLQRMGFYPPPPGASPILGLEACGEITELAPDLAETGAWRLGDTVMALLSGGGYGEEVVVDARHVMPVPDQIGSPDAGAVPEVFLTAYLNLVILGGLRAGERVLIHGGSGGVGTAAIQIAKHLGARVWTTAGSAERASRCEGLGADVAIDYRS